MTMHSTKQLIRCIMKSLPCFCLVSRLLLDEEVEELIEAVGEHQQVCEGDDQVGLDDSHGEGEELVEGLELLFEVLGSSGEEVLAAERRLPSLDALEHLRLLVEVVQDVDLFVAVVAEVRWRASAATSWMTGPSTGRDGSAWGGLWTGGSSAISGVSWSPGCTGASGRDASVLCSRDESVLGSACSWSEERGSRGDLDAGDSESARLAASRWPSAAWSPETEPPVLDASTGGNSPEMISAFFFSFLLLFCPPSPFIAGLYLQSVSIIK